MCTPIIGTIATIVGTVGSVFQGFGQAQAANANAAAANAEGKQAMINARIQSGQQKEQSIYELAKGMASAAGSGSISALDVLTDNADRMGRDVDMILYQGRQRQQMKQYEASVYKQQAGAALMSGFIGGATNALGLFGTPALAPPEVRFVGGAGSGSANFART